MVQRERRFEQHQRFLETKPQPVLLSDQAVTIKEKACGPALLKPGREDVDLSAWCQTNFSCVRSLLARYGVIRFRGFAPHTLAHFRHLFMTICPSLMEYNDRSSPRSVVEDRLYTSTDHPADQHIRMHCELSYSHQWPMTIAFFCLHPSLEGGETPFADTRLVLDRLSAATRERFAMLGVRYCRNLSPGLGLSWREVFGVDSREAVEQRCEQLGIAYKWRDSDLRIEWTRPAIHTHPSTGEQVWFNHAAFFHRQALNPGVATALGSDEQLPFSSSFGDGSPIPVEIFEEIENAYQSVLVLEQWVKGDIVVLDNMLSAHGRMPFRDHREVYVMMGEPN